MITSQQAMICQHFQVQVPAALQAELLHHQISISRRALRVVWHVARQLARSAQHMQSSFDARVIRRTCHSMHVSKGCTLCKAANAIYAIWPLARLLALSVYRIHVSSDAFHVELCMYHAPSRPSSLSLKHTHKSCGLCNVVVPVPRTASPSTRLAAWTFQYCVVLQRCRTVQFGCMDFAALHSITQISHSQDWLHGLAILRSLTEYSHGGSNNFLPSE